MDDDELDIEAEREEEDLSFTAVFRGAALPAPSHRPVAPPPPPSARLLGALLSNAGRPAGPVPPPAAPVPSAPPPGFYGKRAQQQPPQPVPLPLPLPSAPLPPPRPLLTVAEVEARARAAAAAAAAAPPPPPPDLRRRMLSVSELEAAQQRAAAAAAAGAVGAAHAPPPPPAHAVAPPPPRVLSRPPPPQPAPPPLSPPPARQLVAAGAAWTGGEGSGAGVSLGEAPPAPSPLPPPPPPAPAPGGARSRPRYSSQYMGSDEIEQILRIQWAATHPHDAPEYEADYYAAAVAFKRRGGSLGGGGRAPGFAPPPSPHAPPPPGDGSAPFVALDGLGAVQYGSVRRPKPLLQLLRGDGSPPAAQQPGGRLEDDMRVALRGLIEDCWRLLAGADDARRGGAPAAGAPASALSLVLSALHAGDTPSDGSSDGAVAALLRLDKGRAMVGATLARLPDASPGAQRLTWAALRCFRLAFGDGDGDAHGAAALGAALVAKAVAATPLAAAAALTAVAAGGPLPCLDAGTAAGSAGARVLEALFARGGAACSDAAAAPLWRDAFARVFSALSVGLAPAMAAAVAAATRGERGPGANKALPLALLASAQPYAPPAQAAALGAFLQRVS